MDTAVAKAHTELTMIAEEVRKHLQRRDVLTAFLNTYAELSSESLGTEVSKPAESAPEMPMKFGGVPKNRVVSGYLEKVLADGVPRKTADLVKLLEKNGIPIGGVNPTKTLSVLLSTTDRFKSARPHGWTLEMVRPEPVSAGRASDLNGALDRRPGIVAGTDQEGG